MNTDWTIERVPVSRMVRDVSVNPRNPSDTWARKQIEHYNPDILGMFVLSEREVPDETAEGGVRKDLVLLDGSNRHNLMHLVGDTDREVVCQVFHHLTHRQEAKIARELNDRQAWKGLRIFIAECEAGDPTATEIRDTLERYGWSFNAYSKGPRDGLIQGVLPFYRLIKVAGQQEVKTAKAAKGTERWAAAMESGRKDAMRVLEDAAQVYAAAFPSLPSAYAPPIMYGIALVLLVNGSRVNLERLAVQIREHSNGQRFLLNDARSMMGPLRFKLPDAVAQLVIKLYNKNLAGNARARLDERWEPIAL